MPCHCIDALHTPWKSAADVRKCPTTDEIKLIGGLLCRPCPASCSGPAHVLFSRLQEEITLDDLFDTMGAPVCSLHLMEAVGGTVP
jgi:hypothetical protein